MIQISSLSKSYGDRLLFDGVSFAINDGDKIGLVGRNGEGKTTLFKILSGVEEADSGQIIFPPGYRVGHLSQHLEFHEDTTLKEAVTGLQGDARWSDDYKVKAILRGLGFSEEQLDSDPRKLSGGFQIRLNLGKLIASNPNMLLLDEPTNYLDIISLRWLTHFLKSWKGEVIIITHDHGFMNEVTTHTIGIHRAGIRKIAGPTHKYYAQLELEEEVHEQSRLNQEKKIKEVEKFINTFRAKASKAKAVQSRVKSLEKMEKFEKLDEIHNLDFKFTYKPFSSRRLMEIDTLSFAYPGGEQLIKSLSFTVGPKDRIGIIGKNGKGKSTLLRLLIGELSPSEGRVGQSANLSLAYFGQTNIDRLNPVHTIEDELYGLETVDSRTKARSIAGLMMFQGDDALKKISVLSGGEKSRVTLGKILLTPANILFLDEPSNHLDMYSTDALLEAIKGFEGAVVMVTHSEMFLKEAANRLIVFDRNKVEMFEGGYEDFISRVGWSEDFTEVEEKRAEPKGGGKRIRELKKESARIEKKIENTEKKIAEMTARLIEITATGYGKEARELSDQIESSKSSIESDFQFLEKLYDELKLLEN